MKSFSAAIAAICLLACSSTTHAHTWTEMLHLIASNGSYVGATGYPRAYTPRNATGFTDADMVWLLPANNKQAFSGADPMCKPSQTFGNQTAGYPALSAAPGDNVAIEYEENGHVSLPTNQPGKPAGRGTVSIYGTTQPRANDTYLGIHKQWNTAGTGGDKRGRLLATRPFDDGVCRQDNASPISINRAKKYGFPQTDELFCQSSFQIPANAGTSGAYTVYWVWDWPTLYTNGNVQINQSYTSCMDVNLVAKPVPNAGPYNSAQATGTSMTLIGIQAQMSTSILVDPSAAPSPTSDNPGPVQVGATATNVYSTFIPVANSAAASLVPAIPSTSATASALLTSSAIITSMPASSASAAVAPLSEAAKQGFITVTVTATEKVISTTTVVMPSSTSTQQPSFSAHTTATIMSTDTTFQTPTTSSQQSSATAIPTPSPAAFSLASGKYSTNTAVPTPQPFQKVRRLVLRF